MTTSKQLKNSPVDYQKINFQNWWTACDFAFNNKLWGSVTIIRKGDSYVIIDKR